MTNTYTIAGQWRPWRCADCLALNVGLVTATVWDCEKCGQTWRRT